MIYEATVITGDVQHAGTDTQIYMTVFGVYGTSEEMLLPKLEDRYICTCKQRNTRDYVQSAGQYCKINVMFYAFYLAKILN